MRMTYVLVLGLLTACSGGGGGGGGDDTSSPDADVGASGQHVAECAGKVRSDQPSACPHGDCDDSGGEKCTAYASIIPGSTQGLCGSGVTSSYGLYFKDVMDSSKFFYEVVECISGTPKLHACTSGFTTDPEGYSGMPGFVCTQ